MATISCTSKIPSCIPIGKKMKTNHQFDVRAEAPKREKIRARCDAAEKGMRAAVAGVISAAANTVGGGRAVALVDERMGTEGTGLPFGISDNILGWILLGVFGTIWSLYFVYTSTLDDEDEDSGLSL